MAVLSGNIEQPLPNSAYIWPNKIAMRRILLYRILVVAVFALPVYVFGQDAPLPDENPPCGPPFGPVCVPIDGGISLLIAAGMALGGKKAYDAYRNND